MTFTFHLMNIPEDGLHIVTTWYHFNFLVSRFGSNSTPDRHTYLHPTSIGSVRLRCVHSHVVRTCHNLSYMSLDVSVSPSSTRAPVLSQTSCPYWMTGVVPEVPVWFVWPQPRVLGTLSLPLRGHLPRTWGVSLFFQETPRVKRETPDPGLCDWDRLREWSPRGLEWVFDRVSAMNPQPT